MLINHYEKTQFTLVDLSHWYVLTSLSNKLSRINSFCCGLLCVEWDIGNQAQGLKGLNCKEKHT